MSWQAVKAVLELSASGGSARLLLLAIASHAHADGTGAYPSLDTLSRETRLSERSVRYLLRKLERSGELVTEKGAGRRGTNLYSIPFVSQPRQEAAGGEGDSPRQTDDDRGAKVRTDQGQAAAPERSLKSMNKKSEGGHARARKTPLPDYFVPTEEMVAWALGKNPSLDLETETERFVNHCRVNGTESADWSSSWRNWILRTLDFKGGDSTRSGLINST